MQKYGYSPTASGVHSYTWFGNTKLLSKNAPTLSGSLISPDTHVCATLSVFDIITLPPRSTIALFGILHPSSVNSHPATAEPGTGTIVTSG